MSAKTSSAVAVAYLSELLADVIAGRIAIREITIEDGASGDPDVGREPPRSRRYKKWWLARVETEQLYDGPRQIDATGIIKHEELAGLRVDIQAATASLHASTQQLRDRADERHADVMQQLRDLRDAPLQREPAPPPRRFVYCSETFEPISELAQAESLMRADFVEVYRYDGLVWETGSWSSSTGRITWRALDVRQFDDEDDVADIDYHQRRWRRDG